MHWFDCPTCGRRPMEEFAFGGDHHDAPAWLADPDARNLDEVWMFDNPAGPVTERWFHAAGCRRWIDVRRDTAAGTVIG
jgi:heterotetrameric sarcosine oxidase delta subunit